MRNFTCIVLLMVVGVVQSQTLAVPLSTDDVHPIHAKKIDVDAKQILRGTPSANIFIAQASIAMHLPFITVDLLPEDAPNSKPTDTFTEQAIDAPLPLNVDSHFMVFPSVHLFEILSSEPLKPRGESLRPIVLPADYLSN